jgi:hypothetical protein
MRSMLLCAFLLLTALSTAAEEEWPADKLSRTAIARNQETFASLPPFACEMTWSRDPAHFHPDIAILKFNGAARFADWERPGPLGPVGGRVRAVFNNAYFAFTLGDSSPRVAYQYEWDGQSPSTESVRRRAQAEFPPDPLAFAFGTGRQFLKETMDGYRKAFACVAESVTDDKGRNVIRMKVYPQSDSGPSDARWVYDFDPAFNYAITRLVALSQMRPFIVHEVELQPGGRPGVWLPRHIRRTDYTNGSSTPTRTEDYDLKLLTGEDLTDAAFRTAALKLGPDQVLARMPPDGKPGSRVFLVDGVWLPDRYSARLNTAVQTAPLVGAVGPRWPAICAAVIFVAGLIMFICTGGSPRRTQDPFEGK